jgi:hypothetical protein
MAAPVFAGTTVVEPTYQVTPAPMMAEPSQQLWFFGASAGYLDEFEEEMYHVQLGYETGNVMYGWSTALYLEAGWAESDDTRPFGTALETANQELEFIPVTLNLKFSRSIFGGFHAYLGLGAGVAFVDYGVNFGAGGSAGEEDEVLTGQVFGGLGYNFAPQFEVFAGLRWIYIDYDTPTNIGINELQFGDDDFLAELGMRIKF